MYAGWCFRVPVLFERSLSFERLSTSSPTHIAQSFIGRILPFTNSVGLADGTLSFHSQSFDNQSSDIASETSSKVGMGLKSTTINRTRGQIYRAGTVI